MTRMGRDAARAEARSAADERTKRCANARHPYCERGAMLRSICLTVVKVSALVICLGIGASACWVHDGYNRDGHNDRHEEHREDRR
jgi:hypothetical protein